MARRLLLLFCLSLTFLNGCSADEVLTSTAPPSFLVVTEQGVFNSATHAVSSLITSVGSPNFKNVAAEVLRSEVRAIQRALSAVKSLLSSSVNTKPNGWVSDNAVVNNKSNGFKASGFKVHLSETRDIDGVNSDHKPSTLQVLSEEPGPQLNLAKISTPFAAFGSSIASSFALTLFTEFGDRTFFIAAILSLRHPRWIVLAGTCLALIVQTVFSTMVGQLLHLLPASAATSSLMAFPLDDYAAAILLFVFGVVHLRAAWNPEEEQEDSSSCCSENIVDDVYVGCPDECLSPRPTDNALDVQTPLNALTFDPLKDNDYAGTCNCQSADCKICMRTCSDTTSTADVSGHSLLASDQPLDQQRDLHLKQQIGLEGRMSTKSGSLLDGQQKTKNSEFREAEKATQALELRRLRSSPPNTMEVFKETFWVIFVAELGDKSMISTVALAAAQNPYGVFVGSSVAHCLVTLVAVIAGSLLEGLISERIANIVGAILFFTFAIMTTLEGLARQGILLWWFLGENASALCIAYFFSMRNMAIFGASQPTSSISGVFDMLVS